ncbi:MAG: DUF4397 domain-containing protein [Dehalococcoidia bacterium]
MALGRFASRHVLLTVAIAALASLLVSTSALSAQAADTGRVRIMHASPDTPPVDIFVDGQKAVTALAFPKDTGYVTLPVGPHNVKVFVSPSDGTGTPALEANLTIAKGKDYTVLAVGEVGKATLGLLPLEDNNATPANGKAHVRLIHASPDAPAVDVGVAGTSVKVFSNVAYKGVGAHTPVDAGTYNLEVRPAGTSTVALAIPGLALKDRTVYTVVAVGLLANNSLAVIPLVDATAPAPTAPHTGTGLASGGSDNIAFLPFVAVALAILGIGAFATPALARSRRS